MVPLDEAYSFDFTQIKTATNHATDVTNLDLSEEEKEILFLIRENPVVTQKELCEKNWHFIGDNKKNFT